MSKDILDIISAILQLGLLIGALWLANETKALRLVSAAAISHSRDSEINRIAPQLLLTASVDASNMFSALHAENLSTNLAVNSIGFAYDRHNNNFVKCRSIRSFIKAGAKNTSSVQSDRYGITTLLDELTRQLQFIDRAELKLLIDEVVEGETERSIIAFIYHDVMLNPYVRFRCVSIEQGKVSFKSSMFTGSAKALARRTFGSESVNS